MASCEAHDAHAERPPAPAGKIVLTLGVPGLAAVAPSAAANVPDPVAKTITVRVRTAGDAPDGALDDAHARERRLGAPIAIPTVALDRR
jgi:hypothetical protein